MTKKTNGKYELQAFKDGETVAQSFFFNTLERAEERREFILDSFRGYNPVVKIFNLKYNIAIEFQKWKQQARERVAKIAGEEINS
jgi:hypothetical protein